MAVIAVRWPGGERDGVTDDDGLIADQDLLDDEADDPLTPFDVEGMSGGAQPGQEAREGLREAQIDGTVVCLIEDWLKLGVQSLLAFS